MIKANALYYPEISFKNAPLIKAMALFYDNIYRIKPEEVETNDSPELAALLDTGSIGGVIVPTPYVGQASSRFLEKSDNWSAAALTISDDVDEKIVAVHNDKTDVSVRNILRDVGYGSHENWTYMPESLASNLMLYLAGEIAERNNLDMFTHHWGAWTATNYFNVDGAFDKWVAPPEEALKHADEYPSALFSLVLANLVPINIRDIPADKIVSFREKRADEISNFRKSIFELHEEIQKIENNKIKIDVIADKIKAYSRAKEDYQKSADLIVDKNIVWNGFTMIGIPAAISSITGLLGLGAFAEKSAIGCGLALSALFQLKNTEEELTKLRQSTPVAAIVDIHRDFKNYTTQRGGGDAALHAWNCMQEYVND